MRCLPCHENKIADWSADKLVGLKYLLENGTLCQLHASEATERLKSLKKEPSKYVLKQTEKPSGFIPPIIQKPFKDYTEREPNNGELIE